MIFLFVTPEIFMHKCVKTPRGTVATESLQILIYYITTYFLCGNFFRKRGCIFGGKGIIYSYRYM